MTAFLQFLSNGIKSNIEFEHIDPGLAKNTPLTAFGVLAEQRLEIGDWQMPFPGNARHLVRCRFRADMGVKTCLLYTSRCV